MVTNNVNVYQFEVGLDEVFADEVRFRVNVDCVIVVVVPLVVFFPFIPSFSSFYKCTRIYDVCVQRCLYMELTFSISQFIMSISPILF